MMMNGGWGGFGGVTPLAGVWIEILKYLKVVYRILSLPLRECGLKLHELHIKMES